MRHPRTTKTRIAAALFAAGLLVGACGDSAADEDIVDDNAPNIDQGTDAGDTSDSGERQRDNEEQNEGVNNIPDPED